MTARGREDRERGDHDDRDDHALAARLAEDAGQLLLDLRESLGTAGDASNASDASDAGATGDAGDGDPEVVDVLRREGDRRSHELLVGHLAAARPADGLLSEEGDDDARRLDHDRVWIVDPLDGTREYGEGRSDWAVHVALAVEGRPEVGAVALPGLGVTLSTAAPPVPAPAPPASERPRVVVSRTRRPEPVLRMAEALGATLVEMGSAGAKAMAVVRGEADVYAHTGGQYEWDSAAPVAVALAAGLHASRVDGTPLVYNREDPRLPDLVVCRPELADRVLAALRS